MARRWPTTEQMKQETKQTAEKGNETSRTNKQRRHITSHPHRSTNSDTLNKVQKRRQALSSQLRVLPRLASKTTRVRNKSINANASIDSYGQQSTMEDRKQRLKALALKAGRNQKKDDPEEPKTKLKFRNYSATTQDDDDDEARQAKRAKTEDAKSALQIAAERARRDVLAEKLSSGDPNAVGGLAPKKINWDLKKGIEGKLAKLEKRTQRMIVQLLRERLEKEAAESTD